MLRSQLSNCSSGARLSRIGTVLKFSMCKEPARWEKPRIALFQAFYRLHSSTIYAARALARAGYRVDLFLFKVDTSIPMNVAMCTEGVFFHSFDSEKKVRSGKEVISRSQLVKHLRRLALRFPYRALNWLWNWFLLLTSSNRGLFPKIIIDLTVNEMRSGRYTALIGIEKGGLIWADTIARQFPVALIYSSLELYTHNHPFSSRDIWNRRLKAAEVAAHNHCWATIIQDAAREKVLLEDNRIRREMQMLHVPISRMESNLVPVNYSLRRNLGINLEQIVLLCHGKIAEQRLCVEITQVAQDFPHDWLLVFHGWQEGSAFKKIRDADEKRRVRLSSQLVDLSDEPQVVGSADISLVLYRNDSQNDLLTGFSSEKLALSLQCGVPIIAFDYPTYEHIANERCGVLIDDLSEIPSAVQKILDDYSEFKRRALASFGKHYSFERNFEVVLKALHQLRCTQEADRVVSSDVHAVC